MGSTEAEPGDRALDARRGLEEMKDALRAALTSVAVSGPAERPHLPPTSRTALLVAMDDLHDDAVAAFAARGFPREVAETSLADIQRKDELYGDLVDDGWLIDVFLGRVVTLARLQFETQADARGRGIHIPEAGPLTPASVDDSLRLAREYFGADGTYVCTSWVFDPQLRALPEQSNLRAFAERFEVAPAEPTDSALRSVAKFVFRSTPEDVAERGPLHCPSALERIAYEVLAQHGTWSEPTGTLPA
ncbi:hypothetical protein GCM10027414_27790 [Humibacter ginsengiterrae]